MQPDNANPQPDYGFILADGNKKRGPNLPKVNLPKPVLIGIAVLVALMLLIILSGLRGGGKTDSSLQDLIARQNEIVRISQLVSDNLTDPQDQNLNASVNSIFTSEQNQLTAYVGKKNVGNINAFKNTNTDSSLQTASQDNNYDATYLAWLKQSLNSYSSATQSAANSASASTKSILQTDYSDVQTLLAAPQLKHF